MFLIIHRREGKEVCRKFSINTNMTALNMSWVGPQGLFAITNIYSEDLNS